MSGSSPGSRTTVLALSFVVRTEAARSRPLGPIDPALFVDVHMSPGELARVDLGQHAMRTSTCRRCPIPRCACRISPCHSRSPFARAAHPPRSHPNPASSVPPLSPSNALAASIARVEHGLIPEVRVEGEKGGWSIEERLRAHRTPALSVAVIHDHRVAWARAYGVKDARTGERADAETLFQAASISKMVTALAALQAAEASKVS